MTLSLTDHLITALGNQIEIPDLALDDNGWCSLVIDQTVVNIEYWESSDQLFLYTTLGELPTEGRTAIYRQLLEANCFHRQTQGGTLSVDGASELVVLTFKWPLQALDEGKLIQMVENFINVAETWSRRLASPTAASDLPSATPALRPGVGGIRV